MNNPLISVIVPVYNVEPYLDRCVQSIVDQTYTNLEIILVDDGSPDNCPVLCDAWAAKDSRIKVIHKANGGLSDARNAGMAIAAGEYVAFVDSDDWVAPDMYRHLLDRMTADDCDIAACGVEMVWEDGTPSRPLTAPGNHMLDTVAAMEALLDETLLKQPVWYKLYRKELISDIPFPVGKYHEDVFWSYQIIARARRVSVCDTPGYFYLQRAGSIMGTDYSPKRLDAVEAKERLAEYIAQHFPSLDTKARANLLFTCLYHGQLTLKHLSGPEQKRALSYLTKITKKNPLSAQELRGLKPTHRLWLSLAQHAFILTCRLRNAAGIGA